MSYSSSHLKFCSFCFISLIIDFLIALIPSFTFLLKKKSIIFNLITLYFPKSIYKYNKDNKINTNKNKNTK